MSVFRTTLKPTPFPHPMSHDDQCLLLGSCFAEHLGKKLERYKFKVCRNPFGIIYHPMAIAKSLDYLSGLQDFNSDQLVEHQGLWHSFDHHSRFSHPERQFAERNIQLSLDEGRKSLASATWLILTLGTANIFVHQAKEEIVANCHKFPSTTFRRERLSVAAIVDRLQNTITTLHQRWPQLQILLSVSPVRHLRDGLIDNQRSKATLLLATEQLSEAFDFVHYFPAYELLMDDLRDYRFYATDLAHPSAPAVDYVWDFFQASFFSEATLQLQQKIEKIVQASEHLPFHPQQSVHQQFLRQQLEKIAVLEAAYPALDFSREREIFERQRID